MKKTGTALCAACACALAAPAYAVNWVSVAQSDTAQWYVDSQSIARLSATSVGYSAKAVAYDAQSLRGATNITYYVRAECGGRTVQLSDVVAYDQSGQGSAPGAQVTQAGAAPDSTWGILTRLVCASRRR